MWVEERGTSADPADTMITCECGRPSLSLQQAFVPGSLGTCRGERPWLGTPEGCTEDLKLLTRTATNTYFPQVVTIISLPTGDDELGKLVARCEAKLSRVRTEEDLRNVLRLSEELEEVFRSHDPGEIFVRLEAIRRQAESDAAVPPQLAEFDRLASGQPLIGENSRSSILFAETLPRERWDRGIEVDMAFIENLVAVHRVREVMCQYGFTRFEAAPTIIEEEFEDIRLAVDGAPIGEPIEWLPAIEQFGEGFFLHVNASALAEWLAKPGVQTRRDELRRGFDGWEKSRTGGLNGRFPGIDYVLLHSLAHALMIEVAQDCGYPASSIKERIYALRDPNAGAESGRYGILLYTASAGAQGTLGGLVDAALRLPKILEGALRRLEVCSNDPICADHKPDDRNDDRALHGAACHGCLLVAETSCERRNLFLDRALLVNTVADADSGLFALAQE
jgi:MrfA Zn-binding domain